MGVKLLVVVTNHGELQGVPTTGIWFSEFAEPFAIFREAGCSIIVASPLGGPAPIDPRGYPAAAEIANHRDALEILNRTIRLETIRSEEYDAVFMPGGHGPMFDLAGDRRLKELLAEFWSAKKAIGAVCHGPASLLRVVLPGGETLLKGRTVTGFTQEEDAKDALFELMPFSLQRAMEAEGARFIAGPSHQAHVEVDGRLVTGQNPASAAITAESFLKVVAQ